MGVVRLPHVLHLHSGVIAFLVCLVALGAFWLGEKAEQRFGGGEPEGTPTKRFKLTGAIILATLGLILLIANPDKPIIKGPAAIVPSEEAVVETPQPVEIPTEAPQEVPQMIIVEDEGC